MHRVLCIHKIVIVSLTLSFFSCENSGIVSREVSALTLFENTEQIVTLAPEFNGIVTTTPTFTWEPTNDRHVFMGIFSKQIEVEDGRIINSENNIWAWHSGLPLGDEGRVRYADGVVVSNGELQGGVSPGTLENGTYFWGVWAWDNAGQRIKRSSQEMIFTVSRSLIPRITVTITEIEIVQNCDDAIFYYTLWMSSEGKTFPDIMVPCHLGQRFTNGEKITLSQPWSLILSREDDASFTIGGSIFSRGSICFYHVPMGTFSRQHFYSDNEWDPGTHEVTLSNGNNCSVIVRYFVEVS